MHRKEYMAKSGLVDVKIIKYMVPYGTWMAEGRPETRSMGQHEADVM